MLLVCLWMSWDGGVEWDDESSFVADVARSSEDDRRAAWPAPLLSILSHSPSIAILS